MHIPKAVTRDELMAALKPLLDFLGVEQDNVFAENALLVDGDEVHLTLSDLPKGTLAEARATCIGIGRDAEWGWRVTVKIR